MPCLGGKKINDKQQLIILKNMKKKIHLPILIEQDENNVFIVSCPSFKGCHSYGNTIDQAMKNIQEVIEICVEENKFKAK